MSVSMKNQMKHLNENLMMPLMMNLKKNLELNHLEKSYLWVEAIILVKRVPWVGDGGVSCVSLFVVSSADDKNGEVAGNGGVWSDDGSLDRPDSASDAGGVITGVVSGIVVGIVPNKITRPSGVSTLSSDESDETEITEMAITYTRKVLMNHLYINHA
nr:hypothetical protein [Tanacetum cinerariifolium]